MPLNSRGDLFGVGQAVVEVSARILQPGDVEAIAPRFDFGAGEAAEAALLAHVFGFASIEKVAENSYEVGEIAGVDGTCLAIGRCAGAHVVDPDRIGRVSQLRRLLSELQQAGYLTVDVRRGRGRTNICVAALPDDAQDTNEKRSSAADQTSEKRTLTSAQPPENRTSASQKADVDVRQYHYEPIRRSSAASGGGSSGHSSRATFANSEIRNWVVALAGEDAAKSYLDPSTWDARGKRIVCATSTGAARLLERAGSHLEAEGISVALPERRSLDHRMAA